MAKVVSRCLEVLQLIGELFCWLDLINVVLPRPVLFMQYLIFLFGWYHGLAVFLNMGKRGLDAVVQIVMRQV
jgi:hypothetical protein